MKSDQIDNQQWLCQSSYYYEFFITSPHLTSSHPALRPSLQLSNPNIPQHPQIHSSPGLFAHQNILHQPRQIRAQGGAADLAEPVWVLLSSGQVGG